MSSPEVPLSHSARHRACAIRALLRLSLLLTAVPALGRAQARDSTQLDWSAEDSARAAFLTAHGQSYDVPRGVVWAPADSLDSFWLSSFVDSLGRGLANLEATIGGPYPWQRIGARPLRFYLSPGRFVSHGDGHGGVFISLTIVRRGYAPFLHEAVHELLTPTGPFYADEYPDSTAADAAEARFPQWLNEGFADYLAQAAAAATGFREGDVFEIGGLAMADSVCAARLSGSADRAEILDKVGGQGRLHALLTTERDEVAPTFYACSQSLTKHLVDRMGVSAVVGLFPKIPAGTWHSAIRETAGIPLEDIRHAWLGALRFEADSKN